MFRIYVDSAANLPAAVAKKYNINVISFVNEVNGEMLTCFDPALTPEEEREKGHDYYEAVRNGAKIKTGLVNTEQFTDHFREALDNGEDVICVDLSKNISGTFNAARIAAEALQEEYPDRVIRVVDSLNASLAQGILAIYASELRSKGMDAAKTADLLEGAVLSMNGVFTVEDLKYLAHTGRINSTTALIGNVLSIKPILRGSAEGYIVQFSKGIGRKKTLNTLIDLVCNNVVHPEKQILGIAHADAYEESLYVMEKITERTQVRGFINTSYDYCTGSHVGPGTIALFFMGADRELKGSKPHTQLPELFQHIG